MKFILLVFIALGIPFAVPAKGKSKIVIVSITKETILADLDEYASNISKLHVEAFALFPKDSFYNGIAAIKANAAQWDADQMLTQWLILNAKLQDEHTNIIYMGRDIFPYNCYWFAEGVYITQTTDEDLKYLWSKVIAVNHIPIEEVARRIELLLPDKNEPELKLSLPRYLFDPFVIHGLGISSSRTNISYTVVTQKGDTAELHPQASDRRELRLHRGFESHAMRHRKTLPYWHVYDTTSKYIYFQYNTCMNSKQHPFKDEEEALLNDIDAYKPERIIIDLRNNGGGHSRMLGHVIDYIVRSSLNRPGGIYVLTGRRTFSAAILNSVQLKHETYARLVGEETSGSVVHFGAVEKFKLPNTHLEVMYSTQYMVTEEKYDGSLKPDVLIQESLADYIHEKDAALEFAIQSK